MSEHLTRLTKWGHLRDKAREASEQADLDLAFEVRRAHEAGVPKVDIARAAGVSRPTLDKWLREG